MARYPVGARVAVQQRYPDGHIRTPCYIRGKTGVVAAMVGEFPNPEGLARGGDGEPRQSLYRVRFRQRDAWPDYSGPDSDTLDIEIYEHWLDAVEAQR